MLREKHLQKFLSSLFGAVYLFVVLFSQNFHTHDSGNLFKDFHFKKSEKTFTTNHASNNYADCLSCHLVHDGNAFLSENVFSIFKSAEYVQTSDFNYSSGVFCSLSFHFQKRGPPFNFS